MELICEVCQSTLQGPILDLGKHPLCDDLQQVGKTALLPKYLQSIQLCSNCLTAHQLYPVAKEELFKADYHYRAGLTKDVLLGMQNLAESVLAKFSLDALPKNILDVGCNDGSLLKYFKTYSPKSNVIGVDPTNAILEAKSDLDFAIKGFFNEEIAREIKQNYGTMDVITFTNVFAHIEDLPSLLNALKILIGPNTVIVIENHYLGAILEKNQFDTFYHEHPRTYSARSFEYIASSLGIFLNSIEFPSRYGGNIRVTLSAKTSNQFQLPDFENDFEEKFENMQQIYDVWKTDSFAVLKQITQEGPIFGKSLPGRAVMLISALGINAEEMPAVFEQALSPKVGFYVPGTQIEILSDEKILATAPSRIIVWGWHIADEICSYLAELGYKGEIWVPLPKFELYKII